MTTALRTAARWARLTGVALLLALMLAVGTEATQAAAFVAPPPEAIPAVSASVAGAVMGADYAIAAVSSSAAGAAAIACVSSIVCGASVAAGALIVGGVAWLIFSSPDMDIPQGGYAPSWAWVVAPKYTRVSTSMCRITAQATGPSDDPVKEIRFWLYNPSTGATVPSPPGSGQWGGTATYSIARDFSDPGATATSPCTWVLSGISLTAASKVPGYTSGWYSRLCWQAAASTIPVAARSICNYETDHGAAGAAPTITKGPTITVPQRYLVSTGTCMLSNGGTFAASPWTSGNFFESAGNQQAKPPACPSGSQLVRTIVTKKTVGGSLPDVTILDTGAPPAAWSDTANPCSAVNGFACGVMLQHKLTISSDWQNCATTGSTDTTAVNCSDFSATGSNVSTFRCVLRKTSGDKAIVTTYSDLTPCALWTSSPTQNLPDPTTTPTPVDTGDNGSGSGTLQLSPPPTDLGQCAPSGWGILNPAAYVKGMGCVVTWAFVPNASTLTETLAGLRGDLDNTPIGQLFVGVYTVVHDFVIAFTDPAACTTADRIGWNQNAQFVGLPCENPIATTYSPVYIVLSGMLIVTTAVVIWGIISAAFTGGKE